MNVTNDIGKLGQESDVREGLVPNGLREIGHHLREFRMALGLTQSEVAQRSGITLSTVFHLERGDPVRLRSVLLVCKGLGTSFEDIRHRHLTTKSPDNPHVVHRANATVWQSPVDLRRKIPPDNAERIAVPEERLRLGKLGLVPIFAGFLNLLMPDGPGMTLLELFGRYSTPFNHTVYRESVLQCQQGGARLQIGESVVELAPGDFVGYASEEMRWIEPVGVLPADEPTVLLWTGAVRIGKVFQDGKTRTAVRKPKKS